MTDSHDNPADLACYTTDGDDVFVVIGGSKPCEAHGHHAFITIGVREHVPDEARDGFVKRHEFRELINVSDMAAIRLARSLLNVAIVITDAEADNDDESGEPNHE